MAVTIRNDLNDLHQKGLVMRSHGGAVRTDTVLRESPLYERLKLYSEEKSRIGAKAATLINDGETIILDSGTDPSRNRAPDQEQAKPPGAH